MTPKGYRTWSHSVLSSLLLLAVLVLVNILVAPSYARLDLTEEKLYTLSDGSREIVGALRDPIDLTVFWGNVTAGWEAQRYYIEGFLEELQDASNGKVSVAWVDTSTDDGKAKADENKIEARVYGVNEGSRQVREKGHMTLLIESGASDPVRIPMLGSLGPRLEYMLLAEIDKRSRTSTERIGLWIPDSPLMLNNSLTGGRVPGRFNRIKGTIRQAHGKRVLEIPSLEEPVPPDVTVLLVVAPWQVSELSAYHLEQFALRGGRVLLLMDNVNVQNTMLQGQEREPRSSGLEDWLTHLGVTVEYGLVGDFSPANQAINFFNPGGQGHYPYFPKITPNHVDEENLVLNAVPTFPMCWPSTITLDDTVNEGAGRTTRVLASTSKYGHRRAEIGGVGNTARFPVPPDRELESLPLIVEIDGPLTSFWKGKDKPKSPAELAAEAVKKAEEEAKKKAAEGGDGENAAGSPDGDGAGDKPPAPPADPKPKDPAPGGDPKPEEPGGDGGEGDEGEEKKDAGPPRLDEGSIRIVILGDAEICADYMGPVPIPGSRRQMPAPNGMSGFFLIAGFTDWLAGSENLLALRARDADSRQLDEVTQEEKNVIQWVNIAAVPFLLLCIGLVVFAVRRSQRS